MAETPTLTVFLGNPGKQYANTRHNAAWLLCERLESNLNPDWQLKFKGRYAKVQTPGSRPIYLYCFHGFMNKTGEGLQQIAKFFNIEPSEILVIHDELDLEPGTWKLSAGGGLKGHNGLRSIKQHLGSNDFRRCAVGIGRPPHQSFAVNKWVLSAFTNGEMADMNRAFDEIIREVWNR